MDQANYQIFTRLSNSEARQFFLLYVGLDSFLKGYNVHHLTKQQFKKETISIDRLNGYWTKPFSFRLKIEKQSEVEYLLYRNEDRRFIIFRSNSEDTNEFRTIKSYEDDLTQDIIELLLDVAHNDISKDFGYKKINELLALRKPEGFIYRFILGAGINCEYRMPSWRQFEADFIAAVDSKFGKTSCVNINEATFNTNYGTFQIVKDVLNPQYISLLENMIYGAKDPVKGLGSTLEAVSEVLSAQSEMTDCQIALTLNYDGLLEQSLRDCFNLTCKTIYRFDPLVDPTSAVNVVHSHGYLPKVRPIPKRFFNSVVLTTGEYFNNYKFPRSFGYSALYNHLDNTCCFVGNSLTDYEEQKVISAHFAKNPSSFHYWYGAIENRPVEAVMYKTIFLLKMGVIPLWFNGHDEYKREFFDFAERLKQPIK